MTAEEIQQGNKTVGQIVDDMNLFNDAILKELNYTLEQIIPLRTAMGK